MLGRRILTAPLVERADLVQHAAHSIDLRTSDSCAELRCAALRCAVLFGAARRGAVPSVRSSPPVSELRCGLAAIRWHCGAQACTHPVSRFLSSAHDPATHAFARQACALGRFAGSTCSRAPIRSFACAHRNRLCGTHARMVRHCGSVAYAARCRFRFRSHSAKDCRPQSAVPYRKIADRKRHRVPPEMPSHSSDANEHR
jgi:hypothetical protein